MEVPLDIGFTNTLTRFVCLYEFECNWKDSWQKLSLAFSYLSLCTLPFCLVLRDLLYHPITHPQLSVVWSHSHQSNPSDAVVTSVRSRWYAGWLISPFFDLPFSLSLSFVFSLYATSWSFSISVLLHPLNNLSAISFY